MSDDPEPIPPPPPPPPPPPVLLQLWNAAVAEVGYADGPRHFQRESSEPIRTVDDDKLEAVMVCFAGKVWKLRDNAKTTKE